jgi:hypothetical protein
MTHPKPVPKTRLRPAEAERRDKKSNLAAKARLERELDEALMGSFPASDPISLTTP